MGESSRRSNVILLLEIVGDALMNQGFKIEVGKGIEASLDVYRIK